MNIELLYRSPPQLLLRVHWVSALLPWGRGGAWYMEGMSRNSVAVMVPQAALSQCGFNPVCIVPSDFSSDDWQFYLTYFDSVFRLIEEAWTPPAEGEQ